MKPHFWLICTQITLSFALCDNAMASRQSVSIAQFHAPSDGAKDATGAFKKALASGASYIEIPAGTYLIGPETLQVPAGVTVHGDGSSSVLKLAPATETIFKLGANDSLDNLAFDGAKAKSADDHAKGFIYADNTSCGATFRNLKFEQCDRVCIYLDHVTDAVIEDSTFNKVGMAAGINFSHRVRFINNSVTEARLSGVQFWGNQNWQTKDVSDVQIIGNYFKDPGESVWGSGGTRIVMANNIVDGATDLGLDLEWCDDSVISGNTVRNCVNADISLFYSCKHVSITGNTCINDGPVADPKAEWYVRSGIYLTYTNRDVFKQDFGNEDVSIVGNTIWCASDVPRRGIWIGSESNNITLGNNSIDGGGVWKGGLSNVHPMILQKIEDNTIIYR